MEAFSILLAFHEENPTVLNSSAKGPVMRGFGVFFEQTDELPVVLPVPNDTQSWTTPMMTSSNGNFSALLALCKGNSQVTDGFPPQGPVIQSFDVFFDLWKNGSANNRDAGDLRRHRAHYDVTVMGCHNHWSRGIGPHNIHTTNDAAKYNISAHLLARFVQSY